MVSEVGTPLTTLDDRYQLVEVVGRGGMGEVWAGRDLRLGRDVAIKVLSPQMASEVDVRQRFESEARSAARLNHPNVVSVFDSGEHNGVPYLVMELLPGRTLSDQLVAGPLDPDRVRTIGLQVLAALSASHDAGILHRDIKPGNVLLTADGTAKVGDFGIAKSTEGLHQTSVGMIIGTAAYLAPERVLGQAATPQSDLYAVGIVLYEALTGAKPFNADTPLGMLRAIETHAPTPLNQACPGLDPALVASVERAMDRDPGKRFSTAAEMAEALRGTQDAGGPGDETTPIAASSPTQVLSSPRAEGATTTYRATAPESVATPPDRWPGLRDRAPVIVTAAVVLIFVFILLIGMNANSSKSPPDSSVSTTLSTGEPPPSNTAGGLPADLDEAIRRLEKAVQP